jgi:hypothetical protein
MERGVGNFVAATSPHLNSYNKFSTLPDVLGAVQREDGAAGGDAFFRAACPNILDNENISPLK